MPKEPEWEDACIRLTVLENQLACTIEDKKDDESEEENDEGPPALVE